jgi:heptosyltransferase I
LFENSAPEDICIVRLSAIGDTCHALAVVRNLQDNWPDARITWLIGKTEAALLGDIPDVEFITFDKARGSAAYCRLVHACFNARESPLPLDPCRAQDRV